MGFPVIIRKPYEGVIVNEGLQEREDINGATNDRESCDLGVRLNVVNRHPTIR